MTICTGRLLWTSDLSAEQVELLAAVSLYAHLRSEAQASGVAADKSVDNHRGIVRPATSADF